MTLLLLYRRPMQLRCKLRLRILRLSHRDLIGCEISHSQLYRQPLMEALELQLMKSPDGKLGFFFSCCTAAQPLLPTSILLPAGLPWRRKTEPSLIINDWEHGHGLLASVSSTPLALPRLTDFGRLSNCDKASLYELDIMAALRV